MVVLEDRGGGVWDAPGARIIDRSGRRMLPIGNDGFVSAMRASTLVDKTLLAADVLDSGYKVTLFCRPRRFGKTLNLTMLRSFFEAADANGLPADDATALFEGTRVWEAGGGRYREEFQRHPVIYLSLRTAKGLRWEQTLGALRNVILAECQRHAYLLDSNVLAPGEKDYLQRLMTGEGTDEEYADSLVRLARALQLHHGTPVVILVDEYDAPVMAAYSAPNGGYYGEAVAFLKRWLTGALKDGDEALAFACLTGVQRISKESIFSDLNNLAVSTPLSDDSDERYGFTDEEVQALAAHLGLEPPLDEMRRWYDGYRFGQVDVYNPWSVLNYFKKGCVADVYWGNTSSNSVVGDLVRHADAGTLSRVYDLLEPGGVVRAPLDLGVVFPDVGVRPGAIWSMLYLAGYLTTEDTSLPNNTRVARRLRIPDAEIAELYRTEVVERFATSAGGTGRLEDLHEGLATGDEEVVASELGRILRDSASSFDVTSENAAHMLMLGLCFGMAGYGDPRSNRESGYGRPDIQLVPEPTPFFDGVRPLLTIELKYQRDADEDALAGLAREALAQIAERGYDAGPLPEHAHGRARWGIACSGRHVAVAFDGLEG